MRRYYLPAFSLVFLLAACTFKPLYQSSAGIDPISHVSIAEPEDRFTQLVRNSLLKGETDGGGAYRLELLGSTSSSAVVRSKKGINERELLQASVSFRLVIAASGKLALEGQTFANVPFDRADSEFANSRSSDAAVERASEQIADDIRTRLAVYFANKPD